MKRIIITGATGLIGSNIASKLIKRGDEVIVFSRSPERARTEIPGAYDYVKWDYDLKGDWEFSVREADAVVHLAGENVMGGRWTDTQKEKIMNSRKLGTKNLVDVICKNDSKCKTFISASAIGYYNDDISIEVDETSPAGSSFLSKVVSEWENEATKIEDCNKRRVSIRIGIVLSENGGALDKMITPFKFFVGGPLGNGKQWMPWIHIDDLTNLFIYALDNDIKGIINGVAPNPVTMNYFAKTLGQVLKRPSFFKVPEFMLSILLGEAASVVTKGSKVLPKKTMEIGFKYKYEDVREALRSLLN